MKNDFFEQMSWRRRKIVQGWLISKRQFIWSVCEGVHSGAGSITRSQSLYDESGM